MEILRFLLLVELVLLACTVLGMGLAWIIYKQHPDEPFHMFFRLFWRYFFRRHLDVSADPKARVVNIKAIPLEGGARDENAALASLARHGFGGGEDDEEAALAQQQQRQRIAGEGVATIQVKVVPNASRDQVVGLYGDSIKVQVTAPPEDGDANRAVIQLLADRLGIKVYQIQLVTGHYRAQKVVKISGMNQAEVESILAGSSA